MCTLCSPTTASVLFIIPIPPSNRWVCLEFWSRNQDCLSSLKWESITSHHQKHSLLQLDKHTTRKLQNRDRNFTIITINNEFVSHEYNVSFNCKQYSKPHIVWMVGVCVCVGQESGSISTWRFQTELYSAGWRRSLSHHCLWDTAAVWTASSHRPAQSHGTSLPHYLTAIFLPCCLTNCACYWLANHCPCISQPHFLISIHPFFCTDFHFTVSSPRCHNLSSTFSCRC